MRGMCTLPTQLAAGWLDGIFAGKGGGGGEKCLLGLYEVDTESA